MPKQSFRGSNCNLFLNKEVENRNSTCCLFGDPQVI